MQRNAWKEKPKEPVLNTNRLNRFEMRREVLRMAPEISPWVEYTYSVSAQLIVDHNNNVLSKEGVQQGDRLAHLLYSIGADPLVKLVSAIPGSIWSPWYIDDGSIVAPVSVIQDALKAVTTHGPAYGLHLNLGKCSISGIVAAIRGSKRSYPVVG